MCRQIRPRSAPGGPEQRIDPPDSPELVDFGRARASASLSSHLGDPSQAPRKRARPRTLSSETSETRSLSASAHSHGPRTRDARRRHPLASLLGGRLGGLLLACASPLYTSHDHDIIRISQALPHSSLAQGQIYDALETSSS